MAEAATDAFSDDQDTEFLTVKRRPPGHIPTPPPPEYVSEWRERQDFIRDKLCKILQHFLILFPFRNIDQHPTDQFFLNLDPSSASLMSEQEEKEERFFQISKAAPEDDPTTLQYFVELVTHNQHQIEENIIKGEFVEAVKIAIRTSKYLLRDEVTTNPKFYPGLWSCVVGCLNRFGDLIYERICSLGRVSSLTFEHERIHPAIKEKCRNWFLKIAAIREVVPRLLLEIALFKLYRFLYGRAQWGETMTRISRSLRGVCDPLVQVHMRAHLVLRGFEVFGTYARDIYVESVTDILHIFQSIDSMGFTNIAAVSQGLMFGEDYLILYSHTLDIILSCVGYEWEEERVDEFLEIHLDEFDQSAIEYLGLAKIQAETDPVQKTEQAEAIADVLFGGEVLSN